MVNSSDIIAYLERVYPERPVYPAAAAQWVRARAWERCADSVIDPILIDISYWNWAERPRDGAADDPRQFAVLVSQRLRRGSLDEEAAAQLAVLPGGGLGGIGHPSAAVRYPTV